MTFPCMANCLLITGFSFWCKTQKSLAGVSLSICVLLIVTGIYIQYLTLGGLYTPPHIPIGLRSESEFSHWSPRNLTKFWLKYLPAKLLWIINCWRIVDGRTECRRYFYWGVAAKSGWSWSWSWRWSSDEVTVARRFGFSLCAAPPRSFFVLIYEGSIIN